MKTVVGVAFCVLLVLGLLVLVAGCATCEHGAKHDAPKVKRYGSVIGVKPEKLEEYKELHADPWPGVLKTIRDCNIRNYSIYLMRFGEDEYYLFGYFEYIGQDFEADMAKMAEDPVTQDWWKLCIPCQQPLATRAEGEWWANMEEVFHYD